MAQFAKDNGVDGSLLSYDEIVKFPKMDLTKNDNLMLNIEGKMLSFIGMGSAFNTEMGNTSAFVKQNGSLLLIDCGGTVFHRLQELNLFDGLQNLYIIVIHTHPDHVGSLGEVIFYSYYILKHIPIIFFPK